jgi:hypothetical protein
VAVAYDNSTVSSSTTPAQNPSFSHTPAGTPTGVGVIVTWRHTGGAQAITSVTYGGEDCDFEDDQAGSNGQCKVAIYSLGLPPSGAQTVQVNFTGSAPDRGYAICAVTVTGGHTSDVFGTPVTGAATSITPSLTVSADANKLVVDALAVFGTSSNGTAGANQDERMDQVVTLWLGACSTEPGDELVTMSWTLSGSAAYAMAAAAFNEAELGGGESRIMFRGS